MIGIQIPDIDSFVRSGCCNEFPVIRNINCIDSSIMMFKRLNDITINVNQISSVTIRY